MAEKLGVYVHIPFCRSKCDYCDFYSLAGREDRMDDYLKALIAHMKETGPLTRGSQRLASRRAFNAGGRAANQR